ncbi:MAG TPA: hypothetical protein VGG17_10045 [Acidimicrobiales bacterium]
MRRLLIAGVVVIVLLSGALVGHDRSSGAPSSYSSRAAIFQRFGTTYHVTPILKYARGQWLLIARQPNRSTTLVVKIFQLVDSRWSLVGNVTLGKVGYFFDGGKDSLNELRLASLTGGADPDFVVNTSGADTRWFSLLSNVGGRWHALSFDYGSKPTTGIDALGIHGNYVIGETDTCEFSCAGGPETYAWLRFDGTRFVPTAPPGPSPPCNSTIITGVVRADGAHDVTIRRVACEDGWAVGEGVGRYGTAAGVFDEIRGKWFEMALNDSGKAGVVPKGPTDDFYSFAIPYSLMRELCDDVGTSPTWVVTAPMSRAAYLAWLHQGLLTITTAPFGNAQRAIVDNAQSS